MQPHKEVNNRVAHDALKKLKALGKSSLEELDDYLSSEEKGLLHQLKNVEEYHMIRFIQGRIKQISMMRRHIKEIIENNA